MIVKIHAYISPTDITVASRRRMQAHSRYYIRKLKTPSTPVNTRTYDLLTKHTATTPQFVNIGPNVHELHEK